MPPPLLVRATGLEPAHLAIQDPKSCASANFAMPANMWVWQNFFAHARVMWVWRNFSRIPAFSFCLNERYHFIMIPLKSQGVF